MTRASEESLVRRVPRANKGTRESRETWEKRESGAIQDHTESRERKARREPKEVKDPGEKVIYIDCNARQNFCVITENDPFILSRPKRTAGTKG